MNESPGLANAKTSKGLPANTDDLGARQERFSCTECHPETLDDPRLFNVADRWGQLPEALRDQIEALCLQPAS